MSPVCYYIYSLARKNACASDLIEERQAAFRSSVGLQVCRTVGQGVAIENNTKNTLLLQIGRLGGSELRDRLCGKGRCLPDACSRCCYAASIQ